MYRNKYSFCFLLFGMLLILKNDIEDLKSCAVREGRDFMINLYIWQFQEWEAHFLYWFQHGNIYYSNVYNSYDCVWFLPWEDIFFSLKLLFFSFESGTHKVRTILELDVPLRMALDPPGSTSQELGLQTYAPCWASMCVRVLLQRSEDNLWEYGLSFHQMDSGDGTQGISKPLPAQASLWS